MSTGPWAFITNNPWLSLFVLVAAAILIAGRYQETWFEQAREYALDATTPLMDVLNGPAREINRMSEGVGSFWATYEENQRLREENLRLRTSANELAELKRKITRYEELLKIPAAESAQSVGARVIADASGPFVHTVVISAGRAHGVEKGQAVIDERGLLGRVITTGQKSSRVLLLTDLNSRIPVLIEGANLRSILVGDNSGSPTLEYLPSGTRLVAGSRVVTTSDGALFPPGLAVGTVEKGERSPRVKLFTDEARSDFVRVLKYEAPVDVDAVPPLEVPAPATPKPTNAPPNTPVMPATQAGVAPRVGAM